MTGRPVLATPRSRGRTTETVLRGAPTAAGPVVVLGWDAGHRPITLNLAGATREWVHDLQTAVMDAYSHASREMTP